MIDECNYRRFLNLSELLRIYEDSNYARVWIFCLECRWAWEAAHRRPKPDIAKPWRALKARFQS